MTALILSLGFPFTNGSCNKLAFEAKSKPIRTFPLNAFYNMSLPHLIYLLLFQSKYMTKNAHTYMYIYVNMHIYTHIHNTHIKPRSKNWNTLDKSN